MKITPEMIILDTDPIIRTKSEKVTIPLSEEDKELLDAMITYVRRSQDDEIAEAEHLRPAVGIAAIQLGIPKQLIAVSVPKTEATNLPWPIRKSFPRAYKTHTSHKAKAACPLPRNMKVMYTGMPASP